MQNGKTDNSIRDSSNRELKSSTFTTYFGIPENAADLYQGLEHHEKIGPEDITFTTLQGVLFMARKNDMAFTVKKKILVIGEHQSTVNQNMPLRSAIYFGRTLELLVPPKEIYRTSLVSIPTPEFYSFYNGERDQPAERILKLSDAYLEKTEKPMVQLIVREININPSANHPLLHKSRSVYEYAAFIQKIRDYIGLGEERGNAVTLAMEDCIKEGIMTEFISRHGSEVRNMLFTEFNLEDAKEVWKEEAREEGLMEGRREGLKEGLKEGLREGRSEGELLRLISLVQKKYKKNKPLNTIAEELEETEEEILPIYSAVSQHPDDTRECIYEKLKQSFG